MPPSSEEEIQLMEEILHQLINVGYPIIYKVCTFQVVQDFFHQQQVRKWWMFYCYISYQMVNPKW